MWHCRRRLLVALLVSLGWLFPAAGFAQTSWQLASRLQAGLEYDSNIFEASALPVPAPAGRLLFQTRAEKNTARWRVEVDYAGALQVYSQHRPENKLLQDLSGGLLWQATERCKLFARGQAMLKLYLDNVTDYGTTTVLAGLTAAITPSAHFEVSAETGQLDYAIGEEFDYTFNGAGMALRFRPAEKLLCETGVLQRRFHYPARPMLAGAGVLQASPQNDDVTALRLIASYGRKYLLRARLEAQRQRSNRDIFDYDRVQIHFLFGCTPAPRWLLRTAFTLQRKRYLISSSPVPLPELDPEREQSNHAALDLSRNLSNEINWSLRLAYHNNETPVRGLFYRKLLLFTGFELRF